VTEKSLYNSRILLIFVNLLKAKYRQIDPDEVLRHAGIKPYEVTDGGHWFTQTQVDRFIDRLVQVTGNAGIAREGGRYAASGESLKFMGKYVLGLIGPANAFFAINKATSYLSLPRRGAGRLRTCHAPDPGPARLRQEAAGKPGAGGSERHRGTDKEAAEAAHIRGDRAEDLAG
jgi:hypothetical protein